MMTLDQLRALWGSLDRAQEALQDAVATLRRTHPWPGDTPPTMVSGLPIPGTGGWTWRTHSRTREAVRLTTRLLVGVEERLASIVPPPDDTEHDDLTPPQSPPTMLIRNHTGTWSIEVAGEVLRARDGRRRSWSYPDKAQEALERHLQATSQGGE